MIEIERLMCTVRAANKMAFMTTEVVEVVERRS